MKHERAGQPFCPSNGTEGYGFTETYCMNCINCDPDPDGEKQCMILCASLCYSVNDPEYPKEWVYDDEGKPSCTAWVKWDWGNDDDEGGRNEPPPPEPFDPNQLVLPFEMDTILKDHKVKETA